MEHCLTGAKFEPLVKTACQPHDADFAILVDRNCKLRGLADAQFVPSFDIGGEGLDNAL